MSIKQLINNYLDACMLLQIATSVNGVPWICTVCFAFDSDFTLYWFSRHNTRHSQEIAFNPSVAGAIVLPYTLGDKSRGLQVAGTAYELQNKIDITVGLEVLQKRYGVKDERTNQLKKEILTQTADYGLYCLCPDTIILHDTLNFPDSPRQIYHVTKKVPQKHTA